MIAKRSSRALALLLALPSAAFALGLGDIRLLSPLNAPLEAEIDLVDVTPEEMSTVQAQLASRDTFARYGLDWPAYLSGVQVKTVKTADGREVIKLKSTDAISDPFVTLLVEVNWARGKLVREYTMLLDPPVFTPGQPQVASAPVIAPAAGPTVREGAIARATETPAPAAAAAAPRAPPRRHRHAPRRRRSPLRLHRHRPSRHLRLRRHRLCRSWLPPAQRPRQCLLHRPRVLPRARGHTPCAAERPCPRSPRESPVTRRGLRIPTAGCSPSIRRTPAPSRAT